MAYLLDIKTKQTSMTLLHKKIILAFFLSVALIAAMKAQPGSVTLDIDPNAPVIKFEKDTIRYGTVAYNGDGWRSMKIINKGKTPLIIHSVDAECGCTTVEDGGKKTWPQEPIAPGKSGVIRVHYKTSNVGQFTKRVTVNSNASQSAAVFVIKGEVLAEGVKPPLARPATVKSPAKKSVAGKIKPAAVK